ncbi:Chromatin modification-related protein EAF1 A like [Actinidia chinensis var. chinensis]|uniref:Chromatin modification-related protein EAF1 A like n=1 Tax=Actinidia chinensis var. chinensis TaxID=1590841 RepID=A0A2R6PUH8_ACTCC|nr:Chromatin modification-related protein EAF1 A like [Actinidia chinensis var. chinensis]
MVSKVEEVMKKRQQEQQQLQQDKGRESNYPRQIPICHKGKARKFKRSSSNLEEDGASYAILLLACIAFAPNFHT